MQLRLRHSNDPKINRSVKVFFLIKISGTTLTLKKKKCRTTKIRNFPPLNYAEKLVNAFVTCRLEFLSIRFSKSSLKALNL